MLKEQIAADLIESVKKQNELVRSTLRMLNASILNKEKEKRFKISKENPGLQENELVQKSSLTDQEVTDLVFFEVKKREESVLAFEKGNRLDLAEKERQEAAILRKYLPLPLSEDELREIIKEEIAGTKEFGRIMSQVVSKTRNRADGATISRLVKELLS